MAVENWQKGRDGICGEEKARTTSFRACPSIHNDLIKFCKKNGMLRSQVINLAIKEYLAKHSETEKE